MKITSMDISNKEFKKGLRGYISGDVDDFLEKISEDYELMYKENSYLNEKVTALTENVERYSKIENTIQNTLLLAQSSAEQTKQNTQKEAELIINAANETSRRMIDKSNYDVIKINDEYDKVKQDFLRFRSKFRNFMNAQIEMFNGLEESSESSYTKLKNVSSEESTIEKSIIEKEIEPKILNNKKTNTLDEDEASKKPIEEIKNFFVKNE